MICDQRTFTNATAQSDDGLYSLILAQTRLMPRSALLGLLLLTFSWPVADALHPIARELIGTKATLIGIDAKLGAVHRPPMGAKPLGA